MDPLSIISTIESVLQLVAQAKSTVVMAREIRRSPVGATRANESAASFAKRTQDLSEAVRIDKSGSLLTEDERRLCDAAMECGMICSELQKELSKLGWGTGKRSVILSLYFALRSWFARNRIKELDARLARCEGHINVHLLQIVNSEQRTQLADFVAMSEDNRSNFAAIREGIKTLRQEPKLNIQDNSPILQRLKDILEISDDKVLRQRQNQILNAVRFDSMGDRFAGVSDADETTFEWIFDEQGLESGLLDDDESHHAPSMDEADAHSRQLRLEAKDKFVQWLEADPTSEEDSVFHVLGKPGAGKSTLMKYLLEHNKTKFHLQKWSKDKKLVIVSFFFWRPGLDAQKSQRGLVRALLYSILSEARELIPSAFPKHWPDTQLRNNLVNLDLYDFEGAFNSIVRQSQTYARYRFGFFIDGLDEFEDEKHHKTHQFLVSLILGWARESKGCIKIITSSRPIVQFLHGFDKSPRISLQDLTRFDLEAVVTRRLAEVRKFTNIVDSLTLRRIKLSILEKANGVFLWVTLVLNSVEVGIAQGDSWRDLEQKIDTLPTELKDLVQRIIDDINPLDKIKAMKTFLAIQRMIRLGLRFPLSIYLLWDDAIFDPDVVSKLPLSRLSQEQIEDRLARSKRRVYGLFRGLLEVFGCKHGTSINFTHRSVVEVLQLPECISYFKDHLEYIEFEHAIRQCFLGYVKTIQVPDYMDFRYNLEIVIRCYLQGTSGARYHNLQRQYATGFCDFVDQLLAYIEMQQDRKIIFSEIGPASGDREVASLSSTVMTVMKTLIEDCIYEYVFRHKRRFVKIVHALRLVPRSNLLVGASYDCQRWLKMIQVLFDGEAVLPGDASIYLTQVLGYHISEIISFTWHTLRLDEPDDTYIWGHETGYEVTITTLLAYILHGGYMGVSIKLKPDSKGPQWYKVSLATDVGPQGLDFRIEERAEGSVETFLLAPMTEGISPTLRLQDIAEMVLPGRSLAKLREIFDEHKKHTGLDDWQARLLLQAKFGTAAEIWEECWGYHEGNTYKYIIEDWRSKVREDPSWRPPVWERSEP